MHNLPESVKTNLISFLASIPVEKLSSEWKAIQVAISMIATPTSFKKGLHVYLDSYDNARESGSYNLNEMSIKIWPHKIQMRRIHREYVSGTDIDINQIYRYIHPSGRYTVSDFDEIMSNTGDLFNGNYSHCESDYCDNRSIAANFHIETNIK